MALRALDQRLDRRSSAAERVFALAVQWGEHLESYRSAMTDTKTGVSALQFLPERISLSSLREAVQECRGCPLYKHATQAVFGKGRRDARLILVGEQPGNERSEERRVGKECRSR